MSLKLLAPVDNTTFGFTYFSVSETKILALSVYRSLRGFAWNFELWNRIFELPLQEQAAQQICSKEEQILVSSIMSWATEDSESNFGHV